MPGVPILLLQNEVFTENLDDRCLRSLNGYRATCELLTLVPDVRLNLFLGQ